MTEDKNGPAEPLHFRDMLIVLVISLAASTVSFVTLKLIWGKQMTWAEVMIMSPIVAALAAAAGCYLMKKDRKEKK